MFFALWPDRALQTALFDTTRDIVSASGGRATPVHNFHITLAFLGSVPESELENVERVASQVAHELTGKRVQIAFDVAEHWKKARLICVTAHGADPRVAVHGADSYVAVQGADSHVAVQGADSHVTARGPGAVRADTGNNRHGVATLLADTLKARLTTAGFAPDLKPFRPHVTLARNVRFARRVVDIQPVSWVFESFALIESRTEERGSVYRTLATYGVA